MKTIDILTDINEFDGLKNQLDEIDYFRKKNFNEVKKYYIRTWGCQMNEHDSETLSGMLNLMGFAVTNSEEDADIIIYNTCAVREKAENKVFGNIGHLKSLKRKKEDIIVIITGCMTELDYVVDRINNKFSFISLVIGTHSYGKFPELLKKVYSSNSIIINTDNKEDKIIENLPTNRDYNIKSFVNIMHGCNNFCTYCIVPYTRGRERSRLPENIITEIKGLVSNGVREVTLLGQNVNSYGKTEKFDIDFADLLKMINNIDGIERIRFMTSNPKDMTYKLIDTMAECDKIPKFMHLPVQAGSNELLKRMNRKYTIEEYIDKIKYIKKKIPDIALSTDIIVGFPGEKEEDIDKLIELFELIEYDNVFTFIYSKRSGTPANDYENQIPEKEKHIRFERILDKSNEIVIRKNKEYQDKIVEVLVEGVSKNDDTALTGKSSRFKTVNFTGSKDYIGKIVKVLITDARKFTLSGKIVSDKDGN